MDLSPEDDEDAVCDVCELPVADCVCDDFDDYEAAEDDD